MFVVNFVRNKKLSHDENDKTYALLFEWQYFDKNNHVEKIPIAVKNISHSFFHG